MNARQLFCSYATINGKVPSLLQDFNLHNEGIS